MIAEAAEGGVMNVVGVGDVESRGLRRGIVTSAEAVCDSIRKAIEEAERERDDARRGGLPEAAE